MGSLHDFNTHRAGARMDKGSGCEDRMRLGDQMYWAKDHQRNDPGSRREAGDCQQTFLSHLVGLATCSDIFVGNNWWIHNKSRVHSWYHCIFLRSDYIVHKRFQFRACHQHPPQSRLPRFVIRCGLCLECLLVGYWRRRYEDHNTRSSKLKSERGLPRRARTGIPVIL
jgi:hypothetical protein